MAFIVLTTNAQDDQNGQDPCSICGNYFNDYKNDKDMELITTACNHNFHLCCFTQWLETPPLEDYLKPKPRTCCNCREQPLPLIRESGPRINEDSIYCETEAMNACRLGNIKMLNAILQKNKNAVHQKSATTEDVNLLHIAAKNGRVKCLQALLEEGAKIESSMTDGATSLHITAKYGNENCLQALLKKGAKIEPSMTDGATPLHITAKYGNEKCLQALLNAGANPRASTINRLTPIFLAEQYKHYNCLILLMRSADPHYIDDTGLIYPCSIAPLLSTFNAYHRGNDSWISHNFIFITKDCLIAESEIDKYKQPIFIAPEASAIQSNSE